MTSSQQIRVAALIGVITEFILVVPLFLIVPHLAPGPLPLWVEILQAFQVPSGPLIERLYYRTDWVKQLARGLPPHWEVYAAQALVVLVQSTVFALLAFGLMCLYRFRKTGTHLPNPEA